MIRTLLVAAILGFAAPALACGGSAECSKSHCKMKPQSEVETAMAKVEAADGTKMKFAVTGMSCGNCSDVVTSVLNAIKGVNAVAVSHADSVAMVAFDEKKTNVDALIEAVNGIGKFKASDAQPVTQG